MQLRVLGESHVRSAVSMDQAIDAMREAFGQLSSLKAEIPMRTPVSGAGGVTLFMPGRLTETGAMGAKVVSVFEGNPQRGLPVINAVVLMLDQETGLPVALMDGTYLTALRTGAASGLATDYLAREDAAVLTVFGAGAQARTQVEAVRRVREIEEVRVVARTRDSAEAFAGELEGVQARAMEDRTGAVKGADVIVTATDSSSPVFAGADVDPGTHVNGVGSYKPEMQEVDEDLVSRARIVVDDREGALKEAGDLVVPIRYAVISAAQVRVELGHLVNGDEAGRTSDDEITFFKSVGNAAQDLAVARRVVEAAEEEGVGEVVSL